MIRNFKALGLALVAMFAMSALAASAAQAESTEAKFTAAKYPVTFHGTNGVGNEVFQTEAGTVECASTFHGQQGAASTTITAHPTYNSCKAFGFLSATVTTTGCDYLFHLTTKTTAKELEADPTKLAYQAHVDVVCAAGKSIVISSSGCEALVPAQTGLTTAYVGNSGGSIKVDAAVTGVTYNVTKDNFPCPFNGTGVRTNATYTSVNPVTISGTEPGSEPPKSIAIDIG